MSSNWFCKRKITVKSNMKSSKVRRKSKNTKPLDIVITKSHLNSIRKSMRMLTQMLQITLDNLIVRLPLKLELILTLVESPQLAFVEVNKPKMNLIRQALLFMSLQRKLKLKMIKSSDTNVSLKSCVK